MLADILINTPQTTIFFILVIFTLTFWFLIPGYNHFAVNNGPSLLTMIGILGCFWGIAIGLWEFNTGDIQGSVPDLLDGIKTAFIASIAGICGALLIKFRQAFFGSPAYTTDKNNEGATIDDLARLLRELQQSMAGKEDSTLLSQLKLLRQDSNDRMDTLVRSFNKYMEQMAENNSKALIQALQEVIKDFNTKINEQFGENFKQLNSAVEKILVWQEKYREQISEMILQQHSAAKNMTEATARYAELVGKAKIFTDVSEQLNKLLTGLETQRTNLEGALKLLGDLLTKASTSLPAIEKKIIEMTQQIENGVRVNNDQINATIKSVTTSLQTSHTEMKKILTDSMQSANKEINTHIKQMTENTAKQVVALDHALSTELTKSIESLGKQLTALSQQFVNDYGPLTERLRQIVQIPRGV